MSDDDFFHLLTELPPEICHRNILSWLDGKALSTLWLALLACRSTESTKELRAGIVKRGTDRLTIICSEWEDVLAYWCDETISSSNIKNSKPQVLRDSRPNILRALHCFRQFQEGFDSQEELHSGSNEDVLHYRLRSRRLSELMVAVDFFGRSWLNVEEPPENIHHSPSRRSNRMLEWPVWCGKIQVLLWVPRGSFHGFQRVLLEANVVLLSPTWNPLHFPAWQSLGQSPQTQDESDNNMTPNTIQLVVETYNFLPTVPLGRLVGLQANDRDTLTQIALRLSDQNTVAILANNNNNNNDTQPGNNNRRYIQNLCIISRAQARQRLRNMPQLPFAFYARGDYHNNGAEDDSNDHDTDLLCCWQYRDLYEDAMVTTARDCVSYWKRIMETKRSGP